MAKPIYYEGMDPPMEVEVFDHVEFPERGWGTNEYGQRDFIEWGVPAVVTRIISRKKVAVRFFDSLEVVKSTGDPKARVIQVDVKDLTLIARDG